jgi:nitrogenase molybdenum-iron protein alpha/beta subunit
LKGTSLGGQEEFLAAVKSDGVALPDEVTILENPSLAAMREEFVTRMRSRALEGVLGSATDLNVLTTIAAEEAGLEGSTGPLLIEIGFPCRDHHAIQPMPFFGYSGVVVQAQRITSARRLWDTGRDALLP